MNVEEKKAKIDILKQGVSAARIALAYVKTEIDKFDEYYDFIKLAIKRELKQTSAQITDAKNDLGVELLAEDYLKIGEVFENLALNSLVIMLYSIVETGMASLCGALRQDEERKTNKEIRLHYSDLNKSGGYLEQEKRYIEKVIGIDLHLKGNDQWNEINILKAIRNAIVHEEGWLKSNDKILKKHVEQGLIELLDKDDNKGVISGRIIIHFEYIDEIITQIRRFFKELNF